MTDSINKFSYKDIATAAKTGFDWISKVSDPKVVEDSKQKNLKVELCRLVNEASAANEVLPTNISLGVFGASQAGKSYLVSTLAAIGSNDLTTKKDGSVISFFKHLNPEGNDYEATGIVTRFTRNEGRVPEKYPFKVKLFDEVDLVNVLVNSYFKDLSATLKGSQEQQASDEFFSSEDKINAFFDKELKAERYKLQAGEESYVKNNQIVFLAEYVQKVAVGRLAEQSSSSLFWTRACEIIESLNYEGRKAIYSKLWSGLNAFDHLLDVLGPNMQKFKGAHEAYVPIRACVQVNGDVVEKRKGGTLLDIGVLTRMFDESDKYTLKENSDSMIEVALDVDGTQIVEVPFAVLTFATREIAFPLPEGQGSEQSRCGNFDVLDFPGARSRKGDDVALLREPGKADISEYLRRGKVAYLFESYSKRHEIDLLLWCIGVSKQQEVTEPQLAPITQWVYENVGKTPDDRAKFGSIPLIGAYTRFDTPLTNALPKAEDGTKKIKTEVLEDIFKKSMENFKTEWLENWANGKCFGQFFCVRRPNITPSGELYEVEEGTTNEVKLKDDEIVQELHKEYKLHIAVTPQSKYLYQYDEEKHYAQTLDEVLKPGDGGVTYLAQFVKEKFSDYQENRKKVKAELSKEILDRKNELAAFTKSWGQKEKVARQKQEGEKMISYLVQCETLAGTIADFRHFIEIDADKAIEDYNNNRTDGISNNAYRFAKALSAFHFENLNYISKGKGFDIMFKNLCRCYDQKKQNEYASSEELKKQFSFFVDEDASTSEKPIITDLKKLKEKFQNLLIKYTSELEKAYKNLNVEQAVVDKLLPYEDQVTKKYNLAQGQTERALNIISDFNTYLSVGSTDLDIGRFDEDLNYVDDLNLRTNRPLFHEITDYVRNEVNGKECNMYLMPDFSLYKESSSTGVVDKFDKHYYQDYFSVLLDLMVSKNVTGQSLYTLSKEEDYDLCKILDELDKDKA